MPGDLQMMWRARDPEGYHVEYGYSCMGYEIAGALSVKMAAPDREVYAPIPPLGGWWDIPVSEVAPLASGRQARKTDEANKANQRALITPAP